MEEQLKKVNLGIIRYANCWEDADVLVKALRVHQGARVVSIASAGDNSFSLLMNCPDLVVAVDVSKPQLYLVELKKLAILRLSREEYLAFAGFTNSSVKRMDVYCSLQKDLSQEAAEYWNKHYKKIEKGIIHFGKFEKYFRIFSRFVLPLCHSKKNISKLTETKTLEEQKEFYEKKWNNRRWKFLIRIFFGKVLMGKLGRDPKFLKHVNLSVGEYIYQSTGKHLSGLLVQDNCYDEYILTGNFNENLPHYVRVENYDKIKSNIHKLEIMEGLIEDACKKYGHFTHFNLSNIFEYMDENTFRQVAEQILGAAEKGALFVYWNLMVDRRFSSLLNEHIEPLITMSEKLNSEDKCFFYKCIIIDQKK